MIDHSAQFKRIPAVLPEPLIPGILCNPASGRIKKHRQAVREVLNTIPDSTYLEATTAVEIHESIRQLAAAGVNLLILAGGDGTVHGALTHMFGLWQGELPAVAVVPGGTTNMTALDMGVTKKPLAGIRMLAASVAQPGLLRYTLRPVLRIEQGVDTELFGMFFGCGLIPHGVKYFHRRFDPFSLTSEFAGGMVMLAYLFGFLLYPSVLPANHLTLIREDRTIENPGCLAAFSTTLDRLLLGIRPYRKLDRDSLLFTVIENNIKSVWTTLISLLTGNGGLATGVSQEGMGDRLELLFDGDYIVDGELYHARRENGPVVITKTVPLRFLVL